MRIMTVVVINMTKKYDTVTLSNEDKSPERD